MFNPVVPAVFGKAGQRTEKALVQFRKDFMSGGKKVGYHFNLNELIKACEVYNNNYPQWNENQATVFWCQVVGYLERLVSACDAQALRQGIMSVLQNKTLERCFDMDLYLNNGKYVTISYFPLDADPLRVLGVSFAVDPYWGAIGHGILGRRRFKKLCRSKTTGT